MIFTLALDILAMELTKDTEGNVQKAAGCITGAQQASSMKRNSGRDILSGTEAS